MERTHYRSFIMDSGRWDSVVLRDDDIVISTPAKCGTTWMQTCCALLLFGTPDLPRPLAELSPWVDMLTWPLDELVSLLEAQQHRRFLKTHTPLDGLPWNPSVTYICVGRDPRDVALSWDNHVASIDFGKVFTARIAAAGADDLDPADVPPPPPDDPVERFWQWIEVEADASEAVSGLANVVHHVGSFWDRRDEPNIALFHYADLKTDLPGQLQRLASILGVTVPADVLDSLVHAATFEQMKQRADHLAPDTTHEIWQDNERFFHHGRSGRWREVVGETDMARYHERLSALAPDDLAAWLHAGWLATP